MSNPPTADETYEEDAAAFYSEVEGSQKKRRPPQETACCETKAADTPGFFSKAEKVLGGIHSCLLVAEKESSEIKRKFVEPYPIDDKNSGLKETESTSGQLMNELTTIHHRLSELASVLEEANRSI